MSEDTRQLAAMLVPVTDDLLLVPGTVVAEIISWQEPSPVAGKPDWLLGNISWRGLTVPVMSFELVNHTPMSGQTAEIRLAVINGVKGNSQLPFYALVVQGIPRTLKLDADDVSEVKDARKAEFVKQTVKASGALALIPDFDGLEEQLLAY